MISNMNEGTMRVAARIGPSDIIHDKETSQQKAQVARRDRPVEKSEDGARTEGKKTNDKGSSKYLVDENHVVFEKYDAKGELILRIPPSYTPVDERV